MTEPTDTKPAGKKPRRKSKAKKKKPTYPCKIEGCTKLSRGSRGNNMCQKHYNESVKAAQAASNGNGLLAAAMAGPSGADDAKPAASTDRKLNAASGLLTNYAEI